MLEGGKHSQARALALVDEVHTAVVPDLHTHTLASSSWLKRWSKYVRCIEYKHYIRINQ